MEQNLRVEELPCWYARYDTKNPDNVVDQCAQFLRKVQPGRYVGRKQDVINYDLNFPRLE